jgi:hypothetical protein
MTKPTERSAAGHGDHPDEGERNGARRRVEELTQDSNGPFQLLG